MKRLIGILAMLVLAGMLTACGASGKAEDSKEKLSVMTTFYPMYDFTKAIVGDEGEVELLIPAGTDSTIMNLLLKTWQRSKIQISLFIMMKTWKHGSPQSKKHYKKAMSIR